MTESAKLGNRARSWHDERMPVSIRKYENERLPRDITYVRINGRLIPDWDTYYRVHNLLGSKKTRRYYPWEDRRALGNRQSACERDERIADIVLAHACHLMHAEVAGSLATASKVADPSPQVREELSKSSDQVSNATQQRLGLSDCGYPESHNSRQPKE